jgi:hypothetical protein
VVSMRAKFIETQGMLLPDGREGRPRLYMIGIKDEMYLDAFGTSLQRLTSYATHPVDASDYLFSPDIIKDIKKVHAKTKPIDPHSGCAGAFCDFLQERGLNTEQNMTLFNMAAGSKVRDEINKQQKIVPKRNHMSINSVSLKIQLTNS